MVLADGADTDPQERLCAVLLAEAWGSSAKQPDPLLPQPARAKCRDSHIWVVAQASLYLPTLLRKPDSNAAAGSLGWSRHSHKETRRNGYLCLGR